ncbi:hypothetical protein PC123_g26308 [Phytophthora cactorum]|nr:hypothetical protein PC123_g26308 [Phytophthora cactorum]
MALRAEDYVLLHPEDVPTEQEKFQYARVVSVHRATVTLQALVSLSARPFSVERSLAERHKVEPDEATGIRPGVWMRRGIFFNLRGYTYYTPRQVLMNTYI